MYFSAKKPAGRQRKHFFDIVGWIGAALIVGAYLLNSFEILTAKDLSYQVTNLIGALCILIFSLAWKAYPNVITNAVWMAGAVVAICMIVF